MTPDDLRDLRLADLRAVFAQMADQGDAFAPAVLDLFALLDRRGRTIEILAERCATQSEILSRWAERRHAARIAG